MRTIRHCFLGLGLGLSLVSGAIAQRTDTSRYSFVLPALRLSPDARFSGMCNVGIAMPSDANSMHFNPSATAFNPKHFNMGLSYNPNFQSFDEFLNYFSLYKQLGSNRKTVIGGALRFVSMGQVDSLVQNGRAVADRRLNQAVEVNLALARRFGKSFSVSVSGKYIQTSLQLVDSLGRFAFNPSNAFAFDAGLTYNKIFRVKGRPAAFRAGLALTNVGSKLNYTVNGLDGTFLPSNAGLGLSFQFTPIKYFTIVMASDLNKLMVPNVVARYNPDGTLNPDYDANGNGRPDFLEQNVLQAIVNSFRDNPSGEWKELIYSFGFEFWYKKNWALRLGHQGRDYIMNFRERLAAGIGYRFSVVNLNLSYLRQLNAPDGDLGSFNISILVDLSNLGKQVEVPEELRMDEEEEATRGDQ